MLLKPIIIFEDHRFKTASILIKNHLAQLNQLKYKGIGMEYAQQKSIAEYKEGLQFWITEIEDQLKYFLDDARVPNREIAVNLLIEGIKASNETEEDKASYIMNTECHEGNQAKLALINAIQTTANWDCYGLDHNSIAWKDKTLVIQKDTQKIADVDAQREKVMKNEIMKKCKQYNGGTVNILGGYHNKILQNLSKKLPEFEFIIIAILTKELAEEIGEQFPKGTIFLNPEQLTQVQIDQRFKDILTKTYPVINHDNNITKCETALSFSAIYYNIKLTKLKTKEQILNELFQEEHSQNTKSI